MKTLPIVSCKKGKSSPTSVTLSMRPGRAHPHDPYNRTEVPE
jgi:hypothetical protein